MAKQAKSNWSTYKDVIMDAKKGNASRIYLFTGEEKYLIDRTVSSLKKQWISPGAESLDFYNKDMGQSELSISDFQNFVGFVYNKRMHGGKTRRAPLHMVQHAAGGGNDDLGLFL